MILAALATQAVLALVSWTQPSMGTHGWLTGYAFECGSAAVAWRPVNAYDHPGALPGITPGETGSAAHAYVPVTTDPNAALGWRHGGMRLRVRCIVDSTFGLGARDTLGPSNEVVIVEGFPDTLGTDGLWFKRPDPNAVMPGELVFQRTLLNPTTDEGGGPFWHFETYQRWRMPVLCSVYGYFCVAGQRVPCGWVQP